MVSCILLLMGTKTTLVSGDEWSKQELDRLEVAYPKIY